MRDLYKKIDSLITKLNFDEIWKGFTPCDFALYNKETVFLKNEEIPPDERYMGNTAKIIDGKPIAIWHVSDAPKVDPETLASKVVHEMFHGFQMSQGDTRWADEFKLFAYPRDLDNYELKLAENHYLAKAMEENCQTSFEQFSTIRRARKRLIGDFIIEEFKTETLEGTATYVELMALKQISHEKFVDAVEKHIKIIRNPEKLFNIRDISYSVGAMLCIALKVMGINFHHELTETRTLFELIELKPNIVETKFETFQSELQKRFDDFHKSHSNKVSVKKQITGFDPMNMVRLGDEILCEHFVCLDDLIIDGKVLLIMEKNSFYDVVSYLN